MGNTAPTCDTMEPHSRRDRTAIWGETGSGCGHVGRDRSVTFLVLLSSALGVGRSR
jgi:hypothetical protein